MKALWLAKNRRARRGAPRLSLFPFLAVLICTMGALVLLLLFVSRQARLQAARESTARDAEKQTSIAAEMEMVQWRVEQLKKSRKETEAQLAEARLVLGHIEDHGRRLRDQFQELSRQAKKAADEGLKAGRLVAAGEEELRQIEGRIADAQQQLAQTRQAVANRPKSFAIVPYDGPNHTRRRPIYIECRGDAVVLQPEGIVFNEADFDEPLGPGNPLAAAIRAAREQMLVSGSIDPQRVPTGGGGEPYPLLLVRPAGILFYECALAAMKSWGSEFGYELINEAWQLKYPPPDPSLAKAVTQAVFLARQEHLRLIAAAPNKYGKRPRIGAYRSATGGDSGGQGRGGEGESPGVYSSKLTDRYARSASGDGRSATGGNGRSGHGAGGFGGSGEGDGNSGTGIGGSGGHSGDAEFAANNPYAALPVSGATGPPTMFPGGMGNGSGNGTGNGMGGGPGSGVAGAGGAAGSPTMFPVGMGTGSGNGTGNGMGGAPGSGMAGAGGMTGSPTMIPIGPGNGSLPPAPNAPPPASGGQPAGGSPAVAGVVRPEGYINGRPNDGNPSPAPVRPDPSSSLAMAPVTPLRPGEWRPSEETTPPKRDPEQEAKEKAEKKKHPYDKVRMDHDQNDWALRNATRHAAAISRPIHVDCFPDRIVLVPEGDEPRVVFCNYGGPRDADKIVAAVWEIIDTWGMAGREMYWRPVLNFYVVAGAEGRMLDITRSLEGSGLVIERKQ